MLTALLGLFVFGFIGMIVVGVVLALVGMALSVTFGLVGFLLFKVAPILLIGWVVLKLMQRGSGRKRISAADQRWLDGE